MNLSQETEDAITKKVKEADLEYRLQTATRLNCECSTYLMINRDRLLARITATAIHQKEDPADVVARFVAGVHQRHLDGKDIFA